MATDTLDLTDVKFDLLVAEYEQHELKCEINHSKSVCSQEVTHLRTCTCNAHQYLVCANSVAWFESRIGITGTAHDACDRFIDICWTHRPI